MLLDLVYWVIAHKSMFCLVYLGVSGPMCGQLPVRPLLLQPLVHEPGLGQLDTDSSRVTLFLLLPLTPASCKAQVTHTVRHLVPFVINSYKANY